MDLEQYYTLLPSFTFRKSIERKVEQHERVLLVDLHSYDDKLLAPKRHYFRNAQETSTNQDTLKQLNCFLFHEEGLVNHSMAMISFLAAREKRICESDGRISLYIYIYIYM